MKRIAIALVIGLACWGVPEDEQIPVEVFGTAEKPVYMPAGYGFEGDTATSKGPTCAPPWNQDVCLVPNSKIHYTKFHAGTCSSWWQARFVEEWNEMQAELALINDDLDTGANQWFMSAVPPGMSVGTTFQWSCSADAADGALGSFSPNTSNADTIDTANGDLAQYKGGVLKIYVNNIHANADWIAATDEQRIRAARNMIRHELWHQFGHGHENNGLMGGAANYFTTFYYPTTTMYRRQACYNSSNSGLFDDCQ